MFTKKVSRHQGIEASSCWFARLLIITFLNLSFVIGHLSFAQDAPRFYGQEVVVTATKIPHLKSTIPWNVTVISEKEINASNARTVGEIIKQVPGVDTRSNGGLGAVSSAGLRVIGADKTLVLIDGRRANSPLTGGTDLNDILLGEVEKIEIFRSPASALYGSEANGGVINIITKKGTKELASDAAFTYGSFGTRQFKAAYSREDLLLMAEAINSDGFRENSAYNAVNVKGDYSWNLFNNTSVNIDGLYYDAGKGIPNVPSTDPWSASKPKDKQEDKNYYFGLNSKTKWFENAELSARVFRNNGNNTFHSFNLPGTIETISTNNYIQTGLEVRNLHKTEQGNLLYGVDLREDDGDSNASGKHTLSNIASYLQVEKTLWPGANLIAGLRADKHSVAGLSANPRAGIVFPIIADLSFRTTYGTSFRAPTINELYRNAPYESGNQSLKPEKSKTYELGVSKNSGDSLIQLTYHNSDYNNLIYWGYDPITYVLSPNNVASAKIEGYELETEQQFNERLSGFANYTYQTSTGVDPTGTVTVNGEDLIYMPRNKFNLGLRLNDKKLGSGALSLRYVGERNYIDAPPPAYTNIVKQLPGFMVVDLKAFKTVGNFNLSIGADNIFNTYYCETTGFSPVGGLPAVGYPAPGRRCSVGVKWEM